MQRKAIYSIALTFALNLALPPNLHAQTAATPAPAPTAATAPTALPTAYDPKRDPAADLELAVAQAKATHRNVLIEVGGAWCVWCKYMDKFFAQRKDMQSLLNDNYVVLKVNMSRENENKEFLAKFPKITGYPHIFIIVIGEKGNSLVSQPTNVLEDGDESYNKSKFMLVLQQYKPKH
ncbi:MAG: thioredoxin family protein [Acidobacteriaceae bacterium]|nr:thioredoxin family protein [Acidobacteriaceae bacterium]